MTFSPSQFKRGHLGGRGRGRSGRGTFRGSTSFPKTDIPLPAPTASQRHLKTITAAASDTDVFEDQAYTIKDTRYIASYNWLEKNASTILVPGQPPKWLPPIDKQQLEEDSGQYYRDVNSAHHASFPIEPAVRAVYELKPHFDTSQVDLFGCGSTIGNLLSFAGNEDRTFRFGVERIGKTIFLVRKTNSPKELINNVRGYGHTFPEAYTSWDPDVRGSSSHQRIIRYEFAGMQLIIRSEIDGYLPKNQFIPKLTNPLIGENREKPNTQRPNLSDLVEELPLQAVSNMLDQSGSTKNISEGLTIRNAGDVIDQGDIFDLKTRSIKRKDTIQLSEFLPRLWTTQISNFVLGWHSAGVFEDIEIRNVRSDVQKWEEDNQKMLSRLNGTIRAFLQFSEQQSSFEVRRTGLDPLQIWSEVDGWTALPTKLKNQWHGGVVNYGHESEDEGGNDIRLSFEHPETDDDEYLRF